MRWRYASRQISRCRDNSNTSLPIGHAPDPLTAAILSRRLTANPVVTASLPANLVVRGRARWGVRVAVPAGVGLAGPYFEMTYVDAVRGRQRSGLLDCVTARFEDAAPVRPFRWSRGERHFPGWYWSATTGRHVGFESWLERDRLLLMDFDPGVVGIASQPFWLYWHDGDRERRHAPDYFVRRADGSAVVVDIRADDRIKPKDTEAFETTRLACTQAGWRFERIGVPDAVLLANVRWLSRYRHTHGACTTKPGTGSGRSSRSRPRCCTGLMQPGIGLRRCPLCSICFGSRS